MILPRRAAPPLARQPGSVVPRRRRRPRLRCGVRRLTVRIDLRVECPKTQVNTRRPGCSQLRVTSTTRKQSTRQRSLQSASSVRAEENILRSFPHRAYPERSGGIRGDAAWVAPKKLLVSAFPRYRLRAAIRRRWLGILLRHRGIESPVVVSLSAAISLST